VAEVSYFLGQALQASEFGLAQEGLAKQTHLLFLLAV
jgi:hypothetical protein